MEPVFDHSAARLRGCVSLETVHRVLCAFVPLSAALFDSDLPASQREHPGAQGSGCVATAANRCDLLQILCGLSGNHRVLSGDAGWAATGRARSYEQRIAALSLPSLQPE